jgi:ATP-dependent Zn protease
MASSRNTRAAAEARATAYHEAGHAVIRLVKGLTVNRVSIIPGEGFTGVCLAPGVLGYECSGRRERRETGRASVVSCYAGFEAELLEYPNAREEHAADDWENAFRISRQWEVLPRNCDHVGSEAHFKYLERLRAEARRLVRRHRAAIDALAAELLRRQEMNREQVEALVAPFLEAHGQ